MSLIKPFIFIILFIINKSLKKENQMKNFYLFGNILDMGQEAHINHLITKIGLIYLMKSGKVQEN